MQYRDAIGNFTEGNSSIFFIVQIFYMLLARACWQQNFAVTKLSIF